MAFAGSGAALVYLSSPEDVGDDVRKAPGSQAAPAPHGYDDPTSSTFSTSVHAFAPTGIPAERIYSLWQKGHTNPALCKNCYATNSHSAPYCPQARKEGLACAVCFRGEAHVESDCPCPPDVPPEMWDLFVADFYQRISLFKGFGPGGAAKAVLAKYPQQQPILEKAPLPAVPEAAGVVSAGGGNH